MQNRSCLLFVSLTLIISGVCLAAHSQVKKIPVFKNATQENLPAIATRSSNSMDSKSVDLDKDGDLDIVIPVEFLKNTILLNDGTGKFSDASSRLPDKKALISPKPWGYYPYHDSEEAAVADFDGDKNPDIIFASEDDKISEYYLNNGDGTFKDVSDWLPVQGVSNAVVAADFDKDGKIDVIFGNNGQDAYLRNTGGGKFVDETATRLPASNDITQDIEMADFDKDGDIDLLLGNEDKNRLLRNNGKGVFEDVTGLFFNDGLNEETRGATWVDINKDGHLDIYFANVYMFQKVAPIQRMMIWDPAQKKYKDETSARLPLQQGISVIDAKFNDLNGDGLPDIVMACMDKPRIFLNEGTGIFKEFTEQILAGLQFMSVAVDVADFNKDGKPDIYFANFRGSDVLLLQQ